MSKKLLKDNIANIILTDESCRDYLVSIVSSALKMDKNVVKNNLELVSSRVNHNCNLKQNYADNVFVNDTNYINIEVNYNLGYKTDLKNMHYICHLILKQTHSGNKYNKIKPIYQININNYDYYKENKFIYRSVLKEENLNKVRNNFFTIIDINVDFLSSIDYNIIKKEETDSLERLLYIFVCDNKDKLDEIYIGDKIMEKVRNKFEYITRETDEVLYYDHEEFKKAVSYDQGFDDGIKKGIEQGIEQNKKENVLNMLKDNVSVELINKYTNLSYEDIEKIKSNM